MFYMEGTRSMQAFARTDTGCVRSMNQDSFFCSCEPVGPLPNLFIVADGMGGHQAGDYASRFAIEQFVEYVRGSEGDNLIRIIDRGIAYANSMVYEKSCENQELAGMGTTFVTAYMDGSQLFVANVGDSRLYLAGEQMSQVTEDHSYVAAMVRAGELTPEEARNHPDKNVITRALGVSSQVRADFFEVDLAPGDKVLLCSDGLSNMVEDDRMFNILSDNDPEKAVDVLIEEARGTGGLDNITALLIVPEVEEKEVSEC